jgi:hypothetical protein
VGATIVAEGDWVGPGLGFCSGVELAGRLLGVEVAAVATLTAGVSRAAPGVSSALGVGDAGRIFEFEAILLGALATGADCAAHGVSSALGVGDDGRTLEFKVVLLGATFVRTDCVDGTSKIVFSIPYRERKITISETQLIMFCFSLRSGFRCMSSEWSTVFRGNARSAVSS